MRTSNPVGLKALFGATALALGLLASGGPAHAAATIVINNINAAGVGFNDATPAVPVGGNAGVTLGEQRLIAFTYAANLWGATITSNQPIVIQAQFTPLTCTATGAVLGSAGATFVFRDFPGAQQPSTWYSYALANKLAGAELDVAGTPQINARFNSNLGQAGCLTGTFFYLGLDGSHGSNIDFVAVLQHEMAHGLGFQTFTRGSDGTFLAGFPSIWDHYLMGTTTGLLWKDMTNAQRVTSAISLDKLVWTGAGVNSALPGVLRFGLAGATFSGPAAGLAAGTVRVGEASFGPSLGNSSRSGEIMPVVSNTTAASLTGPACGPLTVNDARAVNGKIALIDRGVCGFAVKVKNAQNAGAIGVLIADNVVENAVAPAGLGGTDATIVIPAVRIFKTDGDKLKVALRTRSRTNSGVYAALGLVVQQYAGADSAGRALMFAPSPFQSGSSVSHYDTSASRNQLMEPSINGDLTQSVVPPQDLTMPLLQDIGW